MYFYNLSIICSIFSIKQKYIYILPQTTIQYLDKNFVRIFEPRPFNIEIRHRLIDGKNLLDQSRLHILVSCGKLWV